MMFSQTQNDLDRGDSAAALCNPAAKASADNAAAPLVSGGRQPVTLEDVAAMLSSDFTYDMLYHRDDADFHERIDGRIRRALQHAVRITRRMVFREMQGEFARFYGLEEES